MGSWLLIALDNTVRSANHCIIFHADAVLRRLCKKQILERCNPVACFTETGQCLLAGRSGAVGWSSCAHGELRGGRPCWPGWQQRPPLLLAALGTASAPLRREAAASDGSCLVLHPCGISVWGSACFGVSWAQSLCWGSETENRILPFVCV